VILDPRRKGLAYPGVDCPGPRPSGAGGRLGDRAEANRRRAGGGRRRSRERHVPLPDQPAGLSPNGGGDQRSRRFPDPADRVSGPVGGPFASRGLRGGGSPGSLGPAAVAGAGGDHCGKGGFLPLAAFGGATVAVAPPRLPAPTPASGQDGSGLLL
jgi:hypothetical protein